MIELNDACNKENTNEIVVVLEGRYAQLMKALLASKSYHGFTSEAILKIAFDQFLACKTEKAKAFRVLLDSDYTEQEVKMLFRGIGAPVTTAKILKTIKDLNHLSHRRLKFKEVVDGKSPA